MRLAKWLRDVGCRIRRRRLVKQVVKGATTPEFLRESLQAHLTEETAKAHIAPEVVKDSVGFDLSKGAFVPIKEVVGMGYGNTRAIAPTAEEAQERREAAAEEWDEVCRHDQDVPHFSGTEEIFILWIAQVISTRLKVRGCYGWDSSGTINLASALTDTRITPEDLWSALALGGGEPPKPDGTNDKEIAEWARLMKLAESAITTSRQKPCGDGCRGTMWFYELPQEEVDAEPLEPGRSRMEWICEVCERTEAVAEGSE